MGVFTEQVQGLVSEERTKRQERQRKEQEKQRKEDLKKQLYFILSSYFTEADEMEYKNIYLNLLKNGTKWEIISEITNKEPEEYYLDINYITILNKVKSSYIVQYNEKIKQLKEFKKIQKEQEKQETIKSDKKLKTFIFVFATITAVIIEVIKILAIIFGVPLLFLLSFFFHKR